MRRPITSKNCGSFRPCSRERGVALITALLLLMLLTGMTLAMVLATRSDLITNGYYQNFRGSFYAADSGLAIVRQDMANRMLSKINPSTNADNEPFAAGDPASVVSALTSAWSASGMSGYHNIARAGSVPARFAIDPASLELVPNGCTPGANQYNCDFSYRIVSIGNSGGSQQNRIEERGTLLLFVPYGTTIPRSFSELGLYVGNQDICSGSYWAPGKIWGPVYTDGCFTFGTSGNYIFTDPVNCGGRQAGYQFSNGCYTSNTPSYTYTPRRGSSTTIAPTFQGGLNLGAPLPVMPENDYNQLYGLAYGIESSDQTASPNLSSLLKDLNGSAFSSSASTGVYMNYDTSNNFKGGGFYIAGSASVSLSTNVTATVPRSMNLPPCTDPRVPQCYVQQTYTISQTTGSGRNQTTTTTTITVTAVRNPNWHADDPFNPPYTYFGVGATTVTSGSNTITLSGIPTVSRQDGTQVDNGALLYTSGDITSISGQVQDDTALTVMANGNIEVTGNLKYKTPPIDMSNDTIITNNNTGQALGLYTNTGNVVINSPSSTIEVDASIATISLRGQTNPNIGGMVIDSDSHYIDNLNIVGGRVNNNLFTTPLLRNRNIIFDRRFGRDLTPPFFPLTKPGSSLDANGLPTATFMRTRWVNLTSY